MLPRSVDNLFRKFCRTGDPGALGKVFDRTAPELMRVALYLVRDRHDAEDIVQRAFLSAIEARRRFDPSRPVLPWLLGIVATHAKRLQRERARSGRAVEADPPRAEIDPQTAASQRELHDRLARLRRELGTPYAEVLALHLEDGLDTNEIAARLSRPAGTVRTQLSRARQLLRKHLPSAYLAAVVPAAWTRADLSALGQNVLAAAAPSGPGPTVAALPFGGILMSKKLLAVASIAVLSLVSGLYAVVANGDDAEAPPAQRHAVAESSEHATRAASREAAAAASQRSEATAALREIVDPGFASVSVKVRWADGSPANGCGVWANGLDTARNEPRIAVTGDDGSCLLRHLRPGRWRIATTLTRFTRELVLEADTRPACKFTADACGTVAGRVVDQHGQPVAAATIWLTPQEPRSTQRFGVATSDDRGHFRLRVRDHALLGAEKRGHATSFAVAVDGEAPADDLELCLRGSGCRVEGTVRDELGTPIAWARVHLGANDALTRSLNGPYETERFLPAGPETWTDERGEFAFDGIEPGREIARAWAAGKAPTSAVIEVRGTATRCDFSLARSATVHGRVADGNGAPIAGARVGPPFVTGWLAGATCESDEQGRFRLTDLPLGSVTLSATATAGRASATLELTSGAIVEWNVALQPTRAIRGLVLDPRARPVADLQVAISFGDQVEGAATRTDENGVFELKPTDSGFVDLRIGEIAAPPLRVVRRVAPGTSDLVIRLERRDRPSVRVIGRIVDPNGRPLRATVRASEPRMTQTRTTETAADGTFELGPIAARPHRLSVVTPAHGSVAWPVRTFAVDECCDLGEIVMKRPGRAVVEVLDQQGRATRGFVALYTEDGEWIASARAERGRAEFAALQPGSYLAVCGGAPFAGHARLVVEPAADVLTTLQLRRVGHADVVVTDEPGSTSGAAADLLAFAFVANADGTRGAFAGMFGNAVGTHRIRLWVPPGHYVVELRAGNGRTAVARVAIRDRNDHPRIEVELAAPR